MSELSTVAVVMLSVYVAFCSCGDGWLTIDLIYSGGGVTVPVDQPLKGLPHELKVPASAANQNTTSVVWCHSYQMIICDILYEI